MSAKKLLLVGVLLFMLALFAYVAFSPPASASGEGGEPPGRARQYDKALNEAEKAFGG